jgi:hypothetical protein
MAASSVSGMFYTSAKNLEKPIYPAAPCIAVHKALLFRKYLRYWPCELAGNRFDESLHNRKRIRFSQGCHFDAE